MPVDVLKIVDTYVDRCVRCVGDFSEVCVCCEEEGERLCCGCCDSCSSCEVPTCYDCMHQCVCEDWFCKDCVTACHVCDGVSCDGCAKRCFECEEDVCGNCSSRCDGCDERYCKEHMFGCEACHRSLCINCTIKCYGCAERLCESCMPIIYGDRRTGYYCGSCVAKCSGCEDTFGRPLLEECDLCYNLVCSDCKRACDEHSSGVLCQSCHLTSASGDSMCIDCHVRAKRRRCSR